MSRNIKKVAVLGTGVMGGQIAAHLTNANFEVYAFDMDQETSENGIKATQEIKPAAFYNKKTAGMITAMNYTDHLSKISECDWVLEAISERIDWKKDLYARITPHLSDTAILTSNTSGISLAELSGDMDQSLKDRFFITHFFNPPRYMKLVEVIYPESVDRESLDLIVGILENDLGKGVVHAKDTPNFIANRIGVFGMMNVLSVASKMKLSVEDIDFFTGTLIGRPKSGTFRTADIVGLDTMGFVAKTAYEKCTDDESRETFVLPDYISKMLENKWLGQKSGQGFYKKIEKGVIHSIDLESLEYSAQNKKKYPGVRMAKEFNSLERRIEKLCYCDDPSGIFTWKTISKTLIYSANRIPEIADNIYSIDRSMRWGFAWDRGPFEVWDIIGLERSVERMKEENMKIPSWISEMLSAGNTSFYRYIDGSKHYYCQNKKDYIAILRSSKSMNFLNLKKNSGLIKKNWSASVVDLGDGVAGVELHSVLKEDLNPIDGSIMETFKFARDWTEENGYSGLVISGDGKNFSAGANLNMILDLAERRDWDNIEKVIALMQGLMQELRFAPFPVVAAPFGLVLGGGYETIGACDRIVAAAESYIGLVEVGVGLIPGAGGNLRMISRLTKKIKTIVPGAFPIIQKAFETIGYAKVSFSATQAKAYGYLSDDDIIVANRDHLLSEAKAVVLDMSTDYKAPELEKFKLPGTSGRLAITTMVKALVKTKKISEHDAHIANKLAYVLTGGDKGGPFSPVDEQYLLDIEREAFISLCGEQKTIERIKHMLAKGKPLRN
jgi:3-hydroxyacyl-CoA dehydrogenase